MSSPTRVFDRRTELDEAIRAAREVARDRLVRVNPPLFDQFARFVWHGPIYRAGKISGVTIDKFVASYDRTFNVPLGAGDNPND